MIPLSPTELTVLAFNDVASHDVEWGEKSIPYNNDFNSIRITWKEHFPSLGLNWLRRLLAVNTYEERYQLLAPELHPLAEFLFEALSEPSEGLYTTLADLTDEQRGQSVRSAATADSDSGPLQAWYWAYQAEPASQMYFSPAQRKIRKEGYVFNDQVRLIDWDPFQRPFIPMTDCEDSKESKEQRAQMRMSWHARSRIWSSGGRGWWSEDDQSKLVWPYRGF